MGTRVVIEPLNRIEGNARVTVELDAAGLVAAARVEATELRGFEAIAAGRPLEEMPALTSRICGICPVSHSLASARAGDVLLGAEPPPAARALRRLLQLAQLVESHALSFFHFSGPDLFLGPGTPQRSLFGLAEARPELARDGVRLRRFGQEAIEAIAGRRVHPTFTVPGGVLRPLAAAAREGILAALPGALSAAERALATWWDELPRHRDEVETSAFESPFLALVGPAGEHELVEGRLRLLSARGEVLEDGVDPARYADVIAEAAEPWSYAKLCYCRHLGYPDGLYRVGPLARLNAASGFGTRRADRALRAFRALGRGAVLSSFHAHLARLVEIVGALERIEALLGDPAILGREVLAPPGERREEAVGACEAPRGTLFHHYRVDRDGLVTWASLVVATTQNALAMNRAVLQAARRRLEGTRITDPLLRAIEGAVRAFDPCISCATHAAGGRQSRLRLMGAGGEVLDER